MNPLAAEAALAAAILNAAYLVRHYRHGRRELRAQAIRALGLAIREAFNASENFEPLLTAIRDGLRPEDYGRL